MTNRFYIFWMISSALIGGIVVMGLALLGAMALNPTGYVSPTPWGALLAIAAGLMMYWSLICWALALLRSKPLWALGLVALGLGMAFGYPAYDARAYDRQRAAVAGQITLGPPPDLAGKTVVLATPLRDGECIHDCWNLTRHMQARVLLVEPQGVDFNGPVDLFSLPLLEMDRSSDDDRPRRAENLPDAIDFVVMHSGRSDAFGPAFDRFRPAGIAPHGLHIDALIVPTRDGRRVDFGRDTPVLRLFHVSRTLASTPWLPLAGRQLYWNQSDRVANHAIARDYFCTSPLREDQHWCFNAFD